MDEISRKFSKAVPSSAPGHPEIVPDTGPKPARHKVFANSTTSVEDLVPKERVSAIFDGIVAIAATLLIMSVDISKKDDVLNFGDFARAGHQILNWSISFVMVAVLWKQFHFVFSHSKHWDMRLMTLTFLQGATVSLIPFVSNVAGDYPDSTAAAMVFTGVMAANGYLLSLSAWLLRRKEHLHVADSSYHLLRWHTRAHFLIYSIITFVSMACAIFNQPLWSLLTWALCPLSLGLISRLRP